MSGAETRRAAVAASRMLSARWSEADAVVRDGEAADLILAEARQWDAHAVVIYRDRQSALRAMAKSVVGRACVRERGC